MDLAVVWFFIWGMFWAGYFMLDGFDFGAGMLHNFVARTEDERRVSLNAIGPIWNGNEVWILGAGSSTWAAFPIVYATLISSLYLPVFLIIVSYILRGLALEYRDKVDSNNWRSFWDKSTFLGNFLLALLFGVAFGNIFQGLPIGPQGFEGTFFGLLNPYALLTGLLFVMLFLLHGALWLSLKVEGSIGERATTLSKKIWPVTFGTAAVFLIATYFTTRLFDNFFQSPVLVLIPLLAVGSLFSISILSGKDKIKAFMASCIAIVSVTVTGIVGLFPTLLPSSLDKSYDLTAFNSAASDYSMVVVTVFGAIFIPAMIIYQIWIHTIFRGKIIPEEVLADEDSY